jgi:hypothetical protein
MGYVINRWNGQVVTTVEDGTVDQTLDIKLIGKNYAGYGELQNETFVHMLENFAGTSAPVNAISGQIWFDTNSQKLRFFTGEQIAGVNIWKTAGGVEYGAPPSNPTSGDVWFDTTLNQLKVRTATEWVVIGPQGAGSGTTQMVSRVLRGFAPGSTESANFSVIAAVVNDQYVYVISKDDFSIDLTDVSSQIDGYNVSPYNTIKKGLTLPLTNAAGSSVFDTAPGASNFYFRGTASDSNLLGGIAASQYVTKANTSFTSIVRFSDLGYTVGDENDLAAYIEQGTIPVIENQLGPLIKFRVKDGQTAKETLVINATAVEPGVSLTYTLGSSTKEWANVFATTFTGTATQANSLNVGGSFRLATTAGGANTIAARDGSGNITANIFSGIATSARYADLAEKYLADAEYEVGTVVVIGGEKEVTASNLNQRAIGVVSANPAFMMNKDLEGGTYIALKGRVPVKVVGVVKKGDELVASSNGTAEVGYTKVFAIALETNDDVGVKLVECVIL